jgi:hypothetical protein
VGGPSLEKKMAAVSWKDCCRPRTHRRLVGVFVGLLIGTMLGCLDPFGWWQVRTNPYGLNGCKANTKLEDAFGL